MFAKKSMDVKELIAAAWTNRSLLKESSYADAVRVVMEELDKGRLRVAEPGQDGWQVNEWVKQAILLYFGIQHMQTWEMAPFEFYDKMLLKQGYRELGVRAVPPATARYGSYIAPQVVLMPSYVNIGAYVDEGTMVDTWATVGSCAQIGKNVHLSGGVGIGGGSRTIAGKSGHNRRRLFYWQSLYCGGRCAGRKGSRVGCQCGINSIHKNH